MQFKIEISGDCTKLEVYQQLLDQINHTVAECFDTSKDFSQWRLTTEYTVQKTDSPEVTTKDVFCECGHLYDSHVYHGVPSSCAECPSCNSFIERIG